MATIVSKARFLCRALAALVSVCAALSLSLPLSPLVSPARAADDDTSAAFLTAFPEGDVYQMAVLGDTFSEGLLSGIVTSLGQDKRLNIQRKNIEFSGVMSPSFEAKAKDFQETIANVPLTIAVVMIGENDRVVLRSSTGRKVPIASPEWITEYSRRVDTIMKAIKKKTSGVYWLGLPVLPGAEVSRQIQAMNETLRERAYANGIKFIDIFAGFTDDAGNYSPYGPDLDGKTRVLRSPDGEHFTEAGNRKLAHFLEKELRRDLNEAKSNRNVPLAGNEAEQAKVNPDNANKTVAPSSPAAPANAANAGSGSAQTAPVVKGTKTDGSAPNAATASLSGEQKADNGKISIKVLSANGKEETAAVEIVRPAIPASVVALVARRDSSGQVGDLLVDQLAGGLTLMSSVSSSSAKARGKQSPTQAPYFKLLVKGERLTPKPGRADDTSMPESGENSSQAPAPQGQPKG